MLDGGVEALLRVGVPRGGGEGSSLGGGSVSDGVAKQRSVVSDGARVDVSLDLLNGGDEVAIRMVVENRQSPPWRTAAMVAACRRGALTTWTGEA